jgi:pectate lyase
MACAAVFVAVLVGAPAGIAGGATAAGGLRVIGFGRHADGGEGGAVCVVTSRADAGPASLRDCATRPRTMVTFDPDLGGAISLGSAVNVAHSVTISGPGPVITNGGPGHSNMGLVLSAGNVVLQNLVFSDWGDWEHRAKVAPFPNPVWFDAGSDYAVDHVTFRRNGGKVGIRCASGITIAWSHFLQSDKGVQVGDFSNAQCAFGNTLTLDHNWFDHIGFRSPRDRSGRVHLLNNLEDNWGASAAASVCDGQLASEGNVFRPGGNRKAIVTDASEADEDKCTRPGFSRSTGDLLEGGALVSVNGPDKVFDPALEYRYPPAGASPALATAIVAGAGAAQ